MRTRTRSVSNKTIGPWSGNVTINSTWCNGQVTTGVTTRSYPLTVTDLLEECISDDLGRAKSNACFHRRLHKRIAYQDGYYAAAGPASGPNGATYYVSGEQTPNWGTYSNAVSNHPGMSSTWSVTPAANLQPPSRWTLNTSQINETLLKEDVLERARGLKADVLLNVVEANQMWPAVQSLAGAIPKLRQDWFKIRHLLKTASGAYLAWKFGISPVFSDLMKVHRYLPRLARDMKRHVERDNIRFSNSAIVHMVFTPYLTTTAMNGFVIRKNQSQGRVTSTPEIRYVLTVRPRIQYQTELFAQLDGFMRRFATSPASLAWEKIPFSFVVDWFVDLRGVLRTVDSCLGFSPYEVVSFTRSCSYGVAEDTFTTRYSPCNGSVIADVPCGTTDYNHYERSNVSSMADLPFLNTKFGKNQAGISAALIGQMLSKAK